MPFISRLYSPADFGVFQIFFSIVSLIAMIACFSYHSAIMLPKKDEDAANIVILCIFLIAITSIISTFFFFVFSGYIEIALNTPGISQYFFLLPLAIFINSIAYVLGYWLSRREQFSTIAQANLYSSISGKAVSIGYGSISPSPFGLILGTIINDATILAVTLRRTLAEAHLFRNVSYERIKQLALRYKKFPQYNTIANLASIASTQAIPFALAFFFSPIVVGYYAITYMVIVLPSKLMGNSIETIFFQKASVEKSLTGSAQRIVRTIHKRLISIGMFTCLLLMIIGPELFSFVLGAQWSTAGVYAQILAPWFFVTFISSPLGSIFNIFEKQQVSLRFSVFLLISRIIVLVISGLLHDPILGMLLLSSTGVIFWGWMNMYLLKIAGVSNCDALREIMRYLVFGVFVCLPLLIAKYYSVSSNLLLVIAVVMMMFYYLAIVYRDTQLKEELLNILGINMHK